MNKPHKRKKKCVFCSKEFVQIWHDQVSWRENILCNDCKKIQKEVMKPI